MFPKETYHSAGLLMKGKNVSSILNKEKKRPNRNKYKSKLNGEEERLHAEASDGTSANVPSFIRMIDSRQSLY
jgi:hypothetical protein